MSSLRGAYVSLQDLVMLSDRSPRSRIRKTGLAPSGKLLVSRPKGRGVDFDEVRLYQPGDDVRNIDWNVTARKSTPHTKVFREERERPTLVVVDQSRSMFFGSRVRLKSVAAAEAGARIAFRTYHAGDRVGGIVIGTKAAVVVEPRRTGRSLAEFLGAVAHANQALAPGPEEDDGAQVITDTVGQMRRVARVNFRIVFISDFARFDESAISDILSLSRHNRLQLAFIYDDLEQHLPPASHYSVSDGKSRVRFDSGSRRNQDLYASRFLKRRDSLFSACTAMRVELYEISTTQELDGRLFDG